MVFREMAPDRHARLRKDMVRTQIAARGVLEPRLLAVMESVPRHSFVPDESQEWAYSDAPLPIGHAQTISQPYIVALMTGLLALQGSERVLEVGTGSGYQAAVLGRMAAEVHGVELLPDLAGRAAARLRDLGFDNVHVHTGDGSWGWPEAAPYEAILVAASAPSVPEPLLAQLVEGGRMVLPVGGRGFQQLEVWRRQGGQFEHAMSIPVAFVLLRGEHGWK